MYEAKALAAIVGTDEFAADRTLVQSSLNAIRYNQPTIFDHSAKGRLGHFVECVLASAPRWSDGEGLELCRIAGEVAELLSTDEHLSTDHRGVAPTSGRVAL